MQPVSRKAAPGFITAAHKPEAAEVALDGDGSYVSFSSRRQLIEGTEVLQRLEVVPTYNERPTVACKIINCGTFEP